MAELHLYKCKQCGWEIEAPSEGTDMLMDSIMACYVCHDCPLSLCIECFNNIFYGNKQRQVHPHTLSLRTRPNWICDVCHRNFSGTASFYCKACDFDACSMCYIGY